MGVFVHTYIDDSGKLDRDVMVLCGYAAPWETWRGFQDDWCGLLDKKDIPYLHVADLNLWNPPYDNKRDEWGDTGAAKTLIEFGAIIQTWLGAGRGTAIGISVDAKHWRSMKSEDRRRMGKSPDLFLFQQLVAALLWKHTETTRNDYKIGLTHDDDNNGSRIYELLSKAKNANSEAKNRIASICFADDQLYVGLQAADLLANSCYNEMLRVQQHPESTQSELYKSITYPIGFVGISFDGPTLTQVAKAWPIRHIEYSRRYLYGHDVLNQD